MENTLNRTLAAHRAALEKREYSSVELTRAYLSRIDACDGALGAFLALDESGALRAAEEADARLMRGECLHALDGIPFAAKDNLCTKGLATTCASRMLAHYEPPYDATVIARLRAHGGVLLGKLNMDEFGMGSSTEHSAFGVTKNPKDPSRVAGGSSGGAAAAVAAGEIPYALATDTGGSIRQPASFCGVVGLKPTYGALSRYGLVAFASSLDCVGVLARSVEDCGTVFSSLLGRDERDMTSLDFKDASLDGALRSVSGMRLGVIQGELGNATVQGAVRRAVTLLDRLGVPSADASLPTPQEALGAYYVISCAEASANLARFDGIRYGSGATEAKTLAERYLQSRSEGFGDEVKRRILFGTYVLSEKNREAYYLRACRVRDAIRHQMAAELERCDVLILPSAPTTAFLLGEKQSPEQMYQADLCTVYASLAGFPAVSVPFGCDENGLPLAVQLIAPPMQEARLLAVARAIEEVMA